MDLKSRKQRRLFTGPRDSAYTTFSPDGERVAFGNGSAGWPAYVVPSAGGDAVLIGNAEGRIRGWTRDGRYLMIWRVTGTKTTVGVLDINTRHAAETLHADQQLGSPVLSPDNRWIAFQVDIAARSRVYIAPFRGAAPVPQSEWTSIGPGVVPIFSPDSRTLYFARFPEGSSSATVLYRQPLDAAAHPVGPATEFYRFDETLDMPVINSVTASNKYFYTLLGGGMSDVWLMDLPK